MPIKRWRIEYNTIRPHSALGYCPPAPESITPPRVGDETLDFWDFWEDFWGQISGDSI